MHMVLLEGHFTVLCQKHFENIVGKGENAGNITSVFFFSHNVFFTSQKEILSSANAFNLDQSEILSCCKELIFTIQQNCGVVQTELICKQKIRFLNYAFHMQKGRKRL